MTITRRQLLALLGSAAAGATIHAQDRTQNPIRVGEGSPWRRHGHQQPAADRPLEPGRLLRRFRAAGSPPADQLERLGHTQDELPAQRLLPVRHDAGAGRRSAISASDRAARAAAAASSPACASTSIGYDQPEVRRPEVVHTPQQHTGSIQPARAAEHAALSTARRCRRRVKRTPGCASTIDTPVSIRSSSRWTSAFLARNHGEDTGHLYELRYPATAAPYYFEDRGSDPATLRSAAVQTRNARERLARPSSSCSSCRPSTRRATARFEARSPSFSICRSSSNTWRSRNYVADNDGFNGNWGMNNFYFYRFDNRKLFTFIPWDKERGVQGRLHLLHLAGHHHGLERTAQSSDGPHPELSGSLQPLPGHVDRLRELG